MEHAYTIRPKKTERGTGPFVFNEHDYEKGPVYLDPIAVYMIELTIPAYILAVETASDIQVRMSYFASPESAKGTDHFSEGAEIYFGPINLWEEFTGRNISFAKNIVI